MAGKIKTNLKYSHTEMAGSGNTGSVPRAGLKNTVRFAWKQEGDVRMPRDTFARTVLMGALSLKVPDVMCLQGNSMEEAYDVTFYTESKSDEVMEKVKEAKGERPLSFFNIVCLARRNFRTINIHMYNPHVTDMAVAAFLGRYCEVTSGARYVKDSLGFWNGRRQFQVLLREDPGGFEGFLHPPAVFSLGSDRGMLFYARQPPFCRKCREYGHGTASCGLVKCRFCMSEEHEAKNCTAPKECHGCGSKQHLFRECPARQQTYAAAAAGGRMAGGKGVEEKRRLGEGDLGHRPEEAARRMVSGEPEKQARSLPAPNVGGKVVLERSSVEVVPETQVSTGTQSISRPPGEVGGATGELGSSLDEVFIDEEAFGALVGEMREMVEEIQVSQTRTAEWGSISPLPATPRTKRDASTAQQAQQESGLLLESGEARRKKKKKRLSLETGEGQSGLEGVGRVFGDSATEVTPLSPRVSSLTPTQMEIDLVTPALCMPDGDGVSQAFSGTPGPPIHNPNPLPASWASQRGDAVDGEASEVAGQGFLSVDVRGVGEMVSTAEVSSLSSRGPSLPIIRMDADLSSPGLFLPDGDGVSQVNSGTPGPPIPNPFPASWGSQEDGMGGGRVGGASGAAGPASMIDEDLYPPDRVST